ncbi:MAG: hypothetical protein VX278_12510, partial [Myxococcota bacterium]|nr:hypothetical protein [Myxococcota bacterium]
HANDSRYVSLYGRSRKFPRPVFGAGSTYAIGDGGRDNGSSIEYSTASLYPNSCNPFYGCPALLELVTSLSGISNLSPYYAPAYIMKL